MIRFILTYRTVGLKDGMIMKNTRAHILNVSLSLFLQKGFKDVTMKEIVEKTGMSKGAIYHYFESKEQLFLEIINIIFSSVLDDHYSKCNKDSLHQFYHDYIIHFIGSPNWQNESKNDNLANMNYFSLIFDALKLFPNLHEKLKESLEVQLTVWKEVIHTARNKGEIKSFMDDEQIARMFIYSSDGVGMYSIFIKDSGANTENTLLKLWNSFYEELKA